MTTEAPATTATIGGSNIGGIIGVNPYSSPFQEWLKLTGQHQEDPQKTPLRLGKLLERPIAQWYTMATGRSHQWSDQTGRCGWRSATADAFVVEGPMLTPVAGLECKFVGARQAYRWGDLDTDEVPAEYVAQCLWYIDFYELPTWDICAVFGPSDARIYTIREDREAQAGIREAADKFYTEHILAGEAPPVDSSDRAKEWLRGRFPKDITDIRQATKGEMQLLREYSDARKQAVAFKDLQETLGNSLKLVIGEGRGFESEDGKATWKKAKDSEETDWQAIAELGMSLLLDVVQVAEACADVPASWKPMEKLNVSLDLLQELHGFDRDSIIRHYTRTVEGSRRLTAKMKGE